MKKLVIVFFVLAVIVLMQTSLAKAYSAVQITHEHGAFFIENASARILSFRNCVNFDCGNSADLKYLQF